MICNDKFCNNYEIHKTQTVTSENPARFKFLALKEFLSIGTWLFFHILSLNLEDKCLSTVAM